MAATWPAVLHARSDFLSGGAPAHGEASPGDHLQTLYHYWLVGHQLEHGRAPWRDPYTFRPEAKPQPNFPGWPFGIVFWPLEAVLGFVGGWNALQLLCYCLAGLAACAWLRELGLPRGPALAGGLAFAIAPYRVEQSVGHLLGPISMLIPLSLWAFERARRGSNWWLPRRGRRSRRSRFPDRCISRSVRFRSSSPTRSAARATGACCSVPSGAPSPRSAPVRSSARRVMQAFDPVGRPLARRDHLLLGPRGRLRLAARRPFAERAVRLPRLGHTARRDPRARPPAPRAPLFARRDSRARSSGADSCWPSARTRRSTRRSGTCCRLFVFRACRSGCCRSRLSASRPLCLCDRAGSAQLRRRARRCASPRRPARARLRQVSSRRSGGRSAVGGRDACSSYPCSIPASTTAACTSGTTPPRSESAPAATRRRHRSRPRSSPTGCSGSTAVTGAATWQARSVVSASVRSRFTAVSTCATPPSRAAAWFAARGLLAHGWQRAAHGRPRLGVRARRCRDRAEPASSPHTRGLSSARAGSPGGGVGQVHERDARAILDLRQRHASTDLRPVSAQRRVTVDGREGLKLRNGGWHLVAVDVPSLITVADQKHRSA